MPLTVTYNGISTRASCELELDIESMGSLAEKKKLETANNEVT